MPPAGQLVASRNSWTTTAWARKSLACSPDSPESLWADLPETAAGELISFSACAMDAAGSVDESNWALVPDIVDEDSGSMKERVERELGSTQCQALRDDIGRGG